MSRWRARWARRLDPGVTAVPVRAYEPAALPPGPTAPPPQPPAAPPPPAPNVWPELTHQFALRLLNLVENLRPELDRLEADEEDSTRLARLYRVDHGLTRLRRTAGYLDVLAGVDAGEVTGIRSSLVDVIREAESAIEHYTRVAIGRVVELGVVEYASRDVAWLLAALIENATLYSPGAVTVSAWLLADGGCLMRVEDSGIGIRPDQVAAINAWLDGPVQDVDTETGRHTGLAVAHRLARRHGIGLRLATREPSGTGSTGGTGTVAMVALPPALLCELPTTTPAPGTPAGTPGPGTAAWSATPGGQVRGTAPVAPIRPGDPPRLSLVNGGAHRSPTPPTTPPPAPVPASAPPAQPGQPPWNPRPASPDPTSPARSGAAGPGWEPGAGTGDEATNSIPVPSTLPVRTRASGSSPVPAAGGPAGPEPAAQQRGWSDAGPELEWPPTVATARLRPEQADGGQAGGYTGGPAGGQLGGTGGLPHRQRQSLRGAAGEPWRPGPVDPAARQAFAADLGAFTAGERDARQQSAPPAGGGRSDQGGMS